jgi:hypothetical protein
MSSEIQVIKGGAVYRAPDGESYPLQTQDGQKFLQALAMVAERGYEMTQYQAQIWEEMKALALRSESQAWQESRERIADLKEVRREDRQVINKLLESNLALTREQNRHREELAYSLIGVLGVPLFLFCLLCAGLITSSMRQPARMPVTQPMGVVTWTN